MTWDDDVLEHMTVGVTVTTSELADKIVTKYPSYPRSSLTSKINEALRTLEKYGIVKTTGMDKYGYRRLWERVM